MTIAAGATPGEAGDPARIRLLLMIDSLKAGGAERQFVEHLRHLDPARYELTVALADGGDAAGGYYDVLATLPHVDVTRVRRTWRLGLLRPLRDLTLLIRSRRIEVIHAFLNLSSTLGVAASRITGIPIVASAIRDGRDHGLSYVICRRFQARYAQFLVSNSEAGLKQRFRSWQENFVVIHNGMDLGRFASRREAVESLRSRLPLGDFEHVVGMVASMTHAKDHDTFTQVARHLVNSRPKTAFVVFGDGPTRARTEAAVRSQQGGANVIFAGFCRDIDRLTAGLDVACLFTNHRHHDEGLPNAVLEAMACGVPVVASAGGGTAEILRDEVWGFLVPPGDVGGAAERVGQLLDDPVLRREMGEQGRAFVSSALTVHGSVTAYEALYRRLVAGASA